jgi:outer membrane protein OmpA-like peptidoglycan-associated protein
MKKQGKLMKKNKMLLPIAIMLSAGLLSACSSGPGRVKEAKVEKVAVYTYHQQKEIFNEIEKNMNWIVSDSDAGGVVQRLSPHSMAVFINYDAKHKGLENSFSFDTQKSTLSTDMEFVLREVAFVLKEHPNVQVRVDGHSDNTGLQELNYEVSKERAKEAGEVLTANGMRSYQVLYSDFAGKVNVSGNHKEYSKNTNRRIELYIHSLNVDIPSEMLGKP